MWIIKVSSFLFACSLVWGSISPEESDAFEGDMILSADQLEAIEEQVSKQNAFAAIRTGLWKTNGITDVINYFVEDNVAGAIPVIKQAIAEYENKTCLRFKRVMSKPSGPKIIFYKGSGCTSPVGKRNYGNTISLGRGCWTKGIVIHEIGHSIGLYHEQSRPDRDQYVTINYNNIYESFKFAFNRYGFNRIDSRDTPYDLDSIMHYGSYYFSKNRKLTIETKDPKNQSRIGQRKGFSKIDVIQINKMYCSGKSPTAKTTSPTTTAPMNCVDKNEYCPYWEDYCDTNIYTKKNCLKTCKRC